VAGLLIGIRLKFLGKVFLIGKVPSKGPGLPTFGFMFHSSTSLVGQFGVQNHYLVFISRNLFLSLSKLSISTSIMGSLTSIYLMI